MRIRAFRIALAAALVVAVLAAPTLALAKSFDIADLRIDARFDASGDLYIDELRTFGFDGDFSWVEWRLLKKGSTGIDVVSVSAGDPRVPFAPVSGDAFQPGTYSVSDEGDAVAVRVAIDVSDTDYPILLSYVARGAIGRYSDCADLSWQFVGDQTEVSTRRTVITITPPNVLTKDDVRAWAHGPINGVVSIADDGVVTLSVTDVPPNTFVEARCLYPAATVANAPLAGGAHREAVMKQEAALADETNALRTRARWVYWGITGLVVLFCLGSLVLSIWAFLRHGREYASSFPGGYFREDPRPELHPAVIGSLMRMGNAADSDMAATLLNLADTKVISMRPIQVQKPGIGALFGATEDTYELARVPGAVPPHPLDAELMRILFDEAGDGTKVDLVSLREYAKAHPQTFTSDISGWKQSAQDEAEQLGLLESGSKTWQVLVAIVAVLSGVAGFVASIFLESVPPVLIGLVTALVCGGLAFVMRRRSRQGNELHAQYKALKQFLLDFSRLNEAPPASVILWNRFLVLAVVFGVAEQVMKQLRVVMPQVVNDPAFQTTNWWLYAGMGHGSPLGDVQTAFVSAHQAATSQMSGSSGGGGGFSGGGGFGGGGGGVSAG